MCQCNILGARPKILNKSAAEVSDAAAAEVAIAETVEVITTDTDTITATENLSQHQTGTQPYNF